MCGEARPEKLRSGSNPTRHREQPASRKFPDHAPIMIGYDRSALIRWDLRLFAGSVFILLNVLSKISQRFE